MTDIHNAYEQLERSMKKVGLQLVDDCQDLKTGKPHQFVSLLRKLLIGTSTVVAKQLLGRGCPSHASDKKLVITAFDILRDAKQAPSISVEQFFNPSGFVYHKLMVIVKIIDYVSNNAGTRPAVLTAYVVLPDSVSSSVFDGTDLMSPEFLRSAAYSSRKSASPITMDSSNSDWPFSDFIRQHINENQNKTMTREKFKKNVIRSRTLANMAYVAEENIISHAMVGSPSVPRVSKTRSGSAVKTPRGEIDEDGQESDLVTSPYSGDEAAPTTPQVNSATASGNNQLYSLLRSPAANSGRTPTNKSSSGAKRSSSVPKRSSNTNGKSSDHYDSDEGPYSSPAPVYRRDADGNPIKDSNGKSNNSNSGSGGGGGSAAAEQAIRETEELVRFLESKYEGKLIQKLEEDFHKKMEDRLEQLIDAKVAAAVKDVTERYDFIINKLVAAVDSEFALINNQLKLAASGQRH